VRDKENGNKLEESAAERELNQKASMEKLKTRKSEIKKLKTLDELLKERP